MNRRLGGLTASVVALVTAVATAPAASAVGSEHDTQVSDAPPASTPHVLDGDVMAVAEADGVMVLGGRFTQARNPADGSRVQSRTNLLAFDRGSGNLLTEFDPELDGTVRSVVPSADGQSVFVGGQFGRLDGEPAFKLVKLDAHTGEPVPGFEPPIINAAVMDLDLHDGRLFAAGHFTRIGGQPHEHLAEFDPGTGAVRDGVDSTFGGRMWAGLTQVYKIDVSPDGQTLAAIGNFRIIDGRSRPEIALFDLSTSPASLSSWRTAGFDVRCTNWDITHFSSRDVEFAPDGSYFVVGATGGYPPEGGLCNGVTRWETTTGPGQRPTWYAPTGGDSVYSVAATGTAVYAGGHFRRFNNPVYNSDYRGPGAVEREGLAALDPTNGVPLTWNPGRDRGHAVWDLLATDSGLWVGSDTDRIARYLYRGRIAYFPLAGGKPVPQPASPELPVQLVVADSFGDVTTQTYDGESLTPAEPMSGAGSGWSGVEGVFVAGDQVYSARSDGTFTVRTYDGSTFGPERRVDLNRLKDFPRDARMMTSGFYSGGYLYYTVSGTNALFKRGLTVESEIVGAIKTSMSGAAAGIDFRNVGGMVVAGDHLYWVHKHTQELYRAEWSDGALVPGTSAPLGIELDSEWGGVLFALPAPADEPDPDPDPGPDPDPDPDPPAPVEFVASAANTDQDSAVRRSVTVPASIQAGDSLLLFLSTNSSSATAADPAGWTRLGAMTTTGSTTVAWSRTATADDAGTAVTVQTSAYVRGDLTMAGYRGGAIPDDGFAVAGETEVTASHTTPVVDVTDEGSWLVSYWADKSADTTSWTPPAEQVERHQAAGTGPGHVSELLVDSGAAVPVGTAGGLTAVADGEQHNAVMASVVLAPTGQ